MTAPVVITIVLVAVGATVVVVVRFFQPSYRCTSDPDNPGTNWCSTMTRKAAEASGFVQASPNYRTYAACMRICATNATGNIAPQAADPLLVVEKSTDLKTWTVGGVMEMTWNGEIEWRDPDPPVRQCFYRVREVAAAAPQLKR